MLDFIIQLIFGIIGVILRLSLWIFCYIFVVIAITLYINKGFIYMLLTNSSRADEYQKTKATIYEVIQECHMQKNLNYSGKFPCYAAENIVRLDPKWIGYTVVYHYRLKISYFSPIDKRKHYKTLDMPEITRSNYKTNDFIEIEVHKQNPDKIKPLIPKWW